MQKASQTRAAEEQPHAWLTHAEKPRTSGAADTDVRARGVARDGDRCHAHLALGVAACTQTDCPGIGDELENCVLYRRAAQAVAVHWAAASAQTDAGGTEKGQEARGAVAPAASLWADQRAWPHLHPR